MANIYAMANSCNAHDFILSASALSSPCLDLSRKEITHLPSEFPGCRKLECLYLEGNLLRALPESLFISCRNLRWLDLRNNKLVSLSPSILHLRCLRTLLLENNQLTSLPPQLGRLHHLSGLSLSQNPLNCPPQYVVMSGTKAVLHYLREQLKECQGEEGEEDSDGSLVLPCTSTTHTPSHPPHIPPIHGTVTVPMHADAPPASPALPVWGPLMKSATLHMQRRRLGIPREDTPSPPHSRHQVKRKRRTKPKREVRKDPPPHTQEEQQEIATAIERQKSQQCLENWREEARKLQRQQLKVHRPLHHHATPTAPFGTEEENRTDGDESSPARLRLKAMERLWHGRQGSTDSVRDARERDVAERVHKHTLELREKRRQAGLIPHPSAELLEAENQLAKVMANCEEQRPTREYRLTAFTGELPLGH